MLNRDFYPGSAFFVLQEELAAVMADNNSIKNVSA